MAGNAIKYHMKDITREVTQLLAQRSCTCHFFTCCNGHADTKLSVVKIVTFFQRTSLYRRPRIWTRKEQPNPVLGLIGRRRVMVIGVALAVLSLWTSIIRRSIIDIYRSSVVIPNDYVRNGLVEPMRSRNCETYPINESLERKEARHKDTTAMSLFHCTCPLFYWCKGSNKHQKPK